MSTRIGSEKIIKDGLILNLDASNRSPIIDSTTTNVITNTNLDTGWSKTYCKDK